MPKANTREKGTEGWNHSLVELPLMNTMDDAKVIEFLCQELSINFKSFENETIGPPVKFPLCGECNEMYSQVVKIYNTLEEIRGQLKTIVECMKAKVSESYKKKPYPFFSKLTNLKRFNNCKIFRDQIICSGKVAGACGDKETGKSGNAVKGHPASKSKGKVSRSRSCQTDDQTFRKKIIPYTERHLSDKQIEIRRRNRNKGSQHACIIPSCTCDLRLDHENLSYHRIPNAKCRQDKRKAWINIIRDVIGISDWEPPKIDTMICSRHFEEKDFYFNGATRGLLNNAVPKIYLSETDVSSESSINEAGEEVEVKDKVVQDTIQNREDKIVQQNEIVKYGDDDIDVKDEVFVQGDEDREEFLSLDTETIFKHEDKRINTEMEYEEAELYGNPELPHQVQEDFRPNFTNAIDPLQQSHPSHSIISIKKPSQTYSKLPSLLKKKTTPTSKPYVENTIHPINQPHPPSSNIISLKKPSLAHSERSTVLKNKMTTKFKPYSKNAKYPHKDTEPSETINTLKKPLKTYSRKPSVLKNSTTPIRNNRKQQLKNFIRDIY